jgi:hypothetical protein
MAKRLLGSMRGKLKQRVSQAVLPVAAKLAEGAVAALDAADRLVEKRLRTLEAEPGRPRKHDGAGAPLREGATPKRERAAKKAAPVKKPAPATVSKTRVRAAVAAKRVAEKRAEKLGGFKVKRGQKHQHHR